MSTTLELLGRERPGAEPVLVLGADAALQLGEWRHAERVVELARLAVAGRDGVDRAEVAAALAGLGIGEEGGRLTFLEMPAIGVSSSLLRDRVREGRPIRHLVPDAVADLIAERGLYGRGPDGR
jgi:nicotinate-nucleotide adenylyltransferase